MQPVIWPSEQRQHVLSHAVAFEVSRGARVESHTAFQAVLVLGQPVNHVLHVILTLVTCFLWAPVWIIIALAAGEKRVVVGIDQYGILHKNPSPAAHT